MASDLLDEGCKNRVYCRQVAVKAVHSTRLSGKRNHGLVKKFKDEEDARSFCKTLGSNYPVVYNSSKQEYYVTLVKDAHCFDYFPLSVYKNHSNEKYYGVQGKQEKNKFLQWTKKNGNITEKPDMNGNYTWQKHKDNYRKRSDIKYKDECWLKKSIRNMCKNMCKCMTNCQSNLFGRTKHTNNNETQNNINNTENAFAKPTKI